MLRVVKIQGEKKTKLSKFSIKSNKKINSNNYFISYLDHFEIENHTYLLQHFINKFVVSVKVVIGWMRNFEKSLLTAFDQCEKVY